MATRSARATITIEFDGEITVTPTAAEGGKAQTARIKKKHTLQLANGVGVNQIDRIWMAEGNTIAASQTDIIHLADLATVTAGGAGNISNNIGFGAQNDNLGQAFSIVNLVAILIFNEGTTSLEVERNATTGLPFLSADGDKASLPSNNGAVVVMGGEDAGIVVSGTQDIVNIINLDASAGQYTIIAAGRSA
jgi:hypothetical protein